MPELFCGFRRVDGYGPTQYPVACSPQAWAAGVVFMLIGSMLGLSARRRREPADAQAAAPARVARLAGATESPRGTLPALLPDAAWA